MTGGEPQVALAEGVRQGFEAALRDTLGLSFPASRAKSLERGVDRACAALGEADPSAVLRRVLAGDGAAIEAVIDEVTVGETYLFRDEEHFAFVRDVAIPEAVRRGGTVRLWSAGCATGEEAWSLAIVAREALGPKRGARVEVIGTDLNPRSLRRAERGWYGPWSFRGVDPARRARWFRPAGRGWSVSPELRGAVRFAALNLLDEASPARPRAVDVVLCRNVLIYFDAETIARVTSLLAASLVTGGWLVPGPSDPLLPAGLGLGAVMRGPLAYVRGDAPPVLPTPVPAPRPSPVVRAPPPAPHPPPAAPPPAPPPADLLVVARSLADAGDLAAATRELNKAIVRDALDPAPYLLRSSVRQAGGDDRGACDDADRAVFLDRSLAVAHLLSAASHARLGEAAAARRALRNARALLRDAPDAPVAHGDGRSGRELLGYCDRLARTLGDARRG